MFTPVPWDGSRDKCCHSLTLQPEQLEVDDVEREMDLALLDSGVLFYAGFLATAVAVNLATFAYFFRTTWLIQMVSR